jgi:hypothetical protein
MTNDTTMTHVPMCLACDAHEVAAPFTNDSGEGFCSQECEASANEEAEDGEPHGSYDLSDDGDALASAGWGTDEDYGYGNDADITCWEFDG